MTGCSRTDAGVHADQFCCTARIDTRLPDNRLLAALNAHLPRDIAVYGCRTVPDAFHPRYDARGKIYVYHIWNEPARHPVWERYAWHRTAPLDTARLHTAAQDFVGTRDFSSFCAAGSDVQDRVRTVSRCAVTRRDGLVSFWVQADGFLYNMVRIMVGTLDALASGRLTWDAIPAVLAARDRAAAGPTAPPQGLCLYRVLYDDEDGGDVWPIDAI